jgi:hypothetical protein
MSSLGAKFYPNITNAFLYNMALVKVKSGKAILYRPGQALRITGV